jgi:hypothetical protein
VDGILDGNGLAQRPRHHQAHHVVPDEVVRKHPLMREACERGLFNPARPRTSLEQARLGAAGPRRCAVTAVVA